MDEDLDMLADSIVAGATTKPSDEKPGATGLTEGAPSVAANEDPAEITAAEEVLTAFQNGDASALNEALKNHYTICFGKHSPSKD